MPTEKGQGGSVGIGFTLDYDKIERIVQREMANGGSSESAEVDIKVNVETKSAEKNLESLGETADKTAEKVRGVGDSLDEIGDKSKEIDKTNSSLNKGADYVKEFNKASGKLGKMKTWFAPIGDVEKALTTVLEKVGKLSTTEIDKNTQRQLYNLGASYQALGGDLDTVSAEFAEFWDELNGNRKGLGVAFKSVEELKDVFDILGQIDTSKINNLGGRINEILTPQLKKVKERTAKTLSEIVEELTNINLDELASDQFGSLESRIKTVMSRLKDEVQRELANSVSQNVVDVDAFNMGKISAKDIKKMSEDAALEFSDNFQDYISQKGFHFSVKIATDDKKGDTILNIKEFVDLLNERLSQISEDDVIKFNDILKLDEVDGQFEKIEQESEALKKLNEEIEKLVSLRERLRERINKDNTLSGVDFDKVRAEYIKALTKNSGEKELSDKAKQDADTYFQAFKEAFEKKDIAKLMELFDSKSLSKEELSARRSMLKIATGMKTGTEKTTQEAIRSLDEKQYDDYAARKANQVEFDKQFGKFFSKNLLQKDIVEIQQQVRELITAEKESIQKAIEILNKRAEEELNKTYYNKTKGWVTPEERQRIEEAKQKKPSAPKESVPKQGKEEKTEAPPEAPSEPKRRGGGRKKKSEEGREEGEGGSGSRQQATQTLKNASEDLSKAGEQLGESGKKVGEAAEKLGEAADAVKEGEKEKNKGNGSGTAQPNSEKSKTRVTGQTTTTVHTKPNGDKKEVVRTQGNSSTRIQTPASQPQSGSTPASAPTPAPTPTPVPTPTITPVDASEVRDANKELKELLEQLRQIKEEGKDSTFVDSKITDIRLKIKELSNVFLDDKSGFDNIMQDITNVPIDDTIEKINQLIQATKEMDERGKTLITDSNNVLKNVGKVRDDATADEETFETTEQNLADLKTRLKEAEQALEGFKKKYAEIGEVSKGTHDVIDSKINIMEGSLQKIRDAIGNREGILQAKSQAPTEDPEAIAQSAKEKYNRFYDVTSEMMADDTIYIEKSKDLLLELLDTLELFKNEEFKVIGITDGEFVDSLRNTVSEAKNILNSANFSLEDEGLPDDIFEKMVDIINVLNDSGVFNKVQAINNGNNTVPETGARTPESPDQGELVSGAEQGTEAMDKERVAVIRLAEQLKNLFNLMKNSKVEISANFGDDQVLGMVTSMQRSTVETEDNNIGRMQTIGNHQFGHIHNHPSGNPNFTPGNDFSSLLNGWNLGQRVNALYYNEKSFDENLGKEILQGKVLLMDFSEKTEEEVRQFNETMKEKAQALKDAGIKLPEYIEAMKKAYNEAIKAFNFEDSVKIFNANDVMSIAQHLHDTQQKMISSNQEYANRTPSEELLKYISTFSGKNVTRDDKEIDDILKQFESGTYTTTQAHDKIRASIGSDKRIGSQEEFDRLRRILTEGLKVDVPTERLEQVSQEINQKALTAMEALETIKDEFGFNLEGINPEEYDPYRPLEERLKLLAEARRRVLEIADKTDSRLLTKDVNELGALLKYKDTSVDQVVEQLKGRLVPRESEPPAAPSSDTGTATPAKETAERKESTEATNGQTQSSEQATAQTDAERVSREQLIKTISDQIRELRILEAEQENISKAKAHSETEVFPNGTKGPKNEDGTYDTEWLYTQAKKKFESADPHDYDKAAIYYGKYREAMEAQSGGEAKLLGAAGLEVEDTKELLERYEELKVLNDTIVKKQEEILANKQKLAEGNVDTSSQSAVTYSEDAKEKIAQLSNQIDAYQKEYEQLESDVHQFDEEMKKIAGNIRRAKDGYNPNNLYNQAQKSFENGDRQNAAIYYGTYAQLQRQDKVEPKKLLDAQGFDVGKELEVEYKYFYETSKRADELKQSIKALNEEVLRLQAGLKNTGKTGSKAGSFVKNDVQKALDILKLDKSSGVDKSVISQIEGLKLTNEQAVQDKITQLLPASEGMAGEKIRVLIDGLNKLLEVMKQVREETDKGTEATNRQTDARQKLNNANGSATGSGSGTRSSTRTNSNASASSTQTDEASKKANAVRTKFGNWARDARKESEPTQEYVDEVTKDLQIMLLYLDEIGKKTDEQEGKFRAFVDSLKIKPKELGYDELRNELLQTYSTIEEAYNALSKPKNGKPSTPRKTQSKPAPALQPAQPAQPTQPASQGGTTGGQTPPASGGTTNRGGTSRPSGTTPTVVVPKIDVDAEVEKLETIENKIKTDIPNAITIKNAAFKEERELVGQVIGKEIAGLKHLEKELSEGVPEAVGAKNDAFTSQPDTSQDTLQGELVETKENVEEVGTAAETTEEKVTQSTAKVKHTIEELKVIFADLIEMLKNNDVEGFTKGLSNLLVEDLRKIAVFDEIGIKKPKTFGKDALVGEITNRAQKNFAGESTEETVEQVLTPDIDTEKVDAASKKYKELQENIKTAREEISTLKDSFNELVSRVNIKEETNLFSGLINILQEQIPAAIVVKNDAFKNELDIVKDVITNEIKIFKHMISVLSIDIPRAIEKKNEAFEGEEAVVRRTIDNEIEILKGIQQPLEELAGTFNLKNIGEKDVNRLAETIKKLNDNISESNIESFNHGIQELYTKLDQFSKIKLDGDNIFSALKDILGHAQELKDFANILKESEEKINNAAKKAKADKESNKKVSQPLGDEFEKFTPDSKGWEDFLKLLGKVHLELGDIQSVYRSIRKDEKGQLLESFKVTTKDGVSGTIGVNTEGFIARKDNTASDLEKSVLKFEKLLAALDKVKTSEGLRKLREEIRAVSEELDKAVEKSKLGANISRDLKNRFVAGGSKAEDRIRDIQIEKDFQKWSKEQERENQRQTKLQEKRYNETQYDKEIKKIEALGKARSNYNNIVAENIKSENSATEAAQNTTDAMQQIMNAIVDASEALKNLENMYNEGRISKSKLDSARKLYSSDDITKGSKKSRENVSEAQRLKEQKEAYDKLRETVSKYVEIVNRRIEGVATEEEIQKVEEYKKEIDKLTESIKANNEIYDKSMSTEALNPMVKADKDYEAKIKADEKRNNEAEYDKQIKKIEELGKARTAYNKIITESLTSEVPEEEIATKTEEASYRILVAITEASEAMNKLNEMYNEGRITKGNLDSAKKLYSSEDTMKGTKQSRTDLEEARRVKEQKEAYDQLRDAVAKYVEIVEHKIIGVVTDEEIAKAEEYKNEIISLSDTIKENNKIYDKTTQNDILAPMVKADAEFMQMQKDGYNELKEAYKEYEDLVLKSAENKTLEYQTNKAGELLTRLLQIRDSLRGSTLYDESMEKESMLGFDNLQAQADELARVQEIKQYYADLTKVVKEYADMRKRIASGKALETDTEEAVAALKAQIDSRRRPYNPETGTAGDEGYDSQLEAKAIEGLKNLDAEVNKLKSDRLQKFWKEATTAAEAYYQAAKKVKDMQDAIDSGEKKYNETQMSNAKKDMQKKKQKADDFIRQAGGAYGQQTAFKTAYKDAEDINNVYGSVNSEQMTYEYENADKIYKRLISNAERYYKIVYKQESGKPLTYKEIKFVEELAEGYRRLNAEREEYDKHLSQDNQGLSADYDKAISTAISTPIQEDYFKAGQIISDLGDVAQPTKYLSTFLTDINEKYEQIRQTIATIDWNGASEEEIKHLKDDIASVLSQVDNARNSSLSKPVDQKDVAALARQTQEWIANNSGAKDAAKSLDVLLQSLNNIDSQGELNTVRAAIEDVKKKAYEAGDAGKSFADKLKASFGNLSRYLLSFASFYRIIGVIRNAVNTVKELDSALKSVKMVSSESAKELRNWQMSTFDAADKVGGTAIDIQKSVASWIRLGKTFEEANEAAMASVKLVNVSEFTNIDDATSALLSIRQAFEDISYDDVLDKLNAVGDSFSSTTQQLSDGMKNVSQVLQVSGNSFEQSLALLAAGNDSVQNMEKAAMGIRTIALRIAGTEEAKKQLEDLGESTDDFVVQTSSKVDAKVRNLTKTEKNPNGISVLDDSGRLRSTYDIK